MTDPTPDQPDDDDPFTRYPREAPDDVDPPATHSLVMPFVCVKSVGGPYDDQAFTTGWALGAIDARLAAVAAADGHSLRATVPSEPKVLEQLELIAMRRGFTVNVEPVFNGDLVMPEWLNWYAEHTHDPI